MLTCPKLAACPPLRILLLHQQQSLWLLVPATPPLLVVLPVWTVSNWRRIHQPMSRQQRTMTQVLKQI